MFNYKIPVLFLSALILLSCGSVKNIPHTAAATSAPASTPNPTPTPETVGLLATYGSPAFWHAKVCQTYTFPASAQSTWPSNGATVHATLTLGSVSCVFELEDINGISVYVPTDSSGHCPSPVVLCANDTVTLSLDTNGYDVGARVTAQ